MQFPAFSSDNFDMQQVVNAFAGFKANLEANVPQLSAILEKNISSLMQSSQAQDLKEAATKFSATVQQSIVQHINQVVAIVEQGKIIINALVELQKLQATLQPLNIPGQAANIAGVAGKAKQTIDEVVPMVQKTLKKATDSLDGIAQSIPSLAAFSSILGNMEGPITSIFSDHGFWDQFSNFVEKAATNQLINTEFQQIINTELGTLLGKNMSDMISTINNTKDSLMANTSKVSTSFEQINSDMQSLTAKLTAFSTDLRNLSADIGTFQTDTNGLLQDVQTIADAIGTNLNGTLFVKH